MTFLHDRVAAGERLFGTWCNLGSSITVEMAGIAGFDWVLIDLEHGAGDQESLVAQVQAATAAATAPIVRIAWNDPVRFKRVLDLGVCGVMVPYVQTADEAYAAVRAMRYPPDGVRGVASLTRATGFGAGFADYFDRANRELLTIVQIETPTAVENADRIAAVDGVDVLFIGPLDLSTAMGIQGQYTNPHFLDAVDAVTGAAQKHGKASGTLVLDPAMLDPMMDRGMTFIAMGSDGGLVASGMRANAALLARLREA
ncbi:MAG: 2-dehydro-3-deoxyglucarate aldolase [Spirochaetaceae bacterium]|nr:MAG: 2-dehydro-3-deoxyglucarate aldolase [Spirochaetaceae bacterium]